MAGEVRVVRLDRTEHGMQLLKAVHKDAPELIRLVGRLRLPRFAKGGGAPREALLKSQRIEHIP